MRSAKSDYETNLIQSFATRNSSKIYKYIRGITRQNSIPPTVNFESSSATSDRDRAYLFSAYTSTQSLPTVLWHYDHLKTCHVLSKRFVTSIFLNLNSKSTTFWLHSTQPRLWVSTALGLSY